MSRRPYMRAVSRSGWWFKDARYFRYMMRELTSAFVGGYSILMVIGVYRLSQGKEAYNAFLEAILGPAGFVFAVMTLLFAAYHTYTWFQVTPKAMPLVLLGKRIPGFMIVLAHWIGFVLASAVLWLLVVVG